jgi:iron complex transport system substrate-binding protein
MEINETTTAILDAAFALHREVGPGLREVFYERVLERILVEAGHEVKQQVPVSFTYRELRFDDFFILDMLVDDRVVVELKSADRSLAAHRSQLLTYLRLHDRPVGLLINFGAAMLKDGIVRVANFRASDAASIPRGFS